MNQATLGILYGLLAMIPIGLANAISKRPSQSLGASRLLFYRTILTSILLFVVLLFNLDQSNFNLAYALAAFGLSFIAFIAMLFLYKAYAVGKIGIVTPIMSSSAVISIPLSVIFLEAVLSKTQAYLITLIIIGIILLTINFRDWKKSSLLQSGTGILYAIITAIAYGLFFFLAQIPNRALGQYAAALIFELGILFFTAIQIGISRQNIKIPDRKNICFILSIAVLTVLSILGLYTGLNKASAGVVLAFSSASTLVVCLYGLLIYKEKLSLSQYVGTVIIVLSMVLLSLA